MTFQQLTYVVEISKCGSINKAAHKLFLSQSGISTAVRELEEETGFKAETMEYLMTINTTVAFCDEAIDLFVARDLVKTEQHLDADESIDVEEWEVKDLLELIYGGKLTDGKTVAAIMAYAQREGIR